MICANSNNFKCTNIQGLKEGKQEKYTASDHKRNEYNHMQHTEVVIEINKKNKVNKVAVPLKLFGYYYSIFLHCTHTLEGLVPLKDSLCTIGPNIVQHR